MIIQCSFSFGSRRFCALPFLLFFFLLCGRKAQSLHTDVEECLVERGSDSARTSTRNTNPESELDNVEERHPELKPASVSFVFFWNRRSIHLDRNELLGDHHGEG